jgi:hypothetical protein
MAAHQASAAGVGMLSSAMPIQSLPWPIRAIPGALPLASWARRVSPTSYQAEGLPPPPSMITAHSWPSRASMAPLPTLRTVTPTVRVGARRSPPRSIDLRTTMGSSPAGVRTRATASVTRWPFESSTIVCGASSAVPRSGSSPAP